jgi:hypothetical protein
LWRSKELTPFQINMGRVTQGMVVSSRQKEHRRSYGDAAVDGKVAVLMGGEIEVQ